MASRFPLLPDYEVLAEIGTGTLGTVFKALSRRFHDLQALKRVEQPPPELRTRLRRDYRAAAAVEHASLARLHDFLEVGPTIYIASEFVDGTDLLGFVQPPVGASRDGLRRALFVFGQLFKALEVLHHHRIIHRGLKPSNLLVTRDGVLKVLDAGLGRDWSLVESDGATSPVAMDRIAAYHAPEQIAGAGADARSDLYAAGLLLYQAITGERPHEAPTAIASLKARMELEAPRLEAGDRAVTAGLGPVVARLLRRDPTERYATAAAAFHDLKEAWRGIAPQPAPPPRPAATQDDTRPMVVPADIRIRPKKPPADLNVATTAELRISDLDISQVFARDDLDPHDHGRLVARSEEIAVLQRELDASRAGGGRAVVVSGPTGSGKSRLLAELAARATESRTVVLRGRGGRGAGPLPDLLEAVCARISSLEPANRGQLLPSAEDAGALADLAPALRDLVDGPAEPPRERGARAERRRDAILRLLEKLADYRPLLVLLEDGDDADADAARLVEQVVRGLRTAGDARSSPVLVVLTHAPEEALAGQPMAQVVEALVTANLATQVRLGPLDRVAIEEVLRHRLGVDAVPEPVTEAVLDAAGGIPGLALCSLDQLRDRGAIEVRDGAPVVNIAELTRQASPPPGALEMAGLRLRALSPDELEMARLVALAGGAGTRVVLARASGRSAQDLDRLLQSLAGKGLVVDQGASLKLAFGLLRPALLDGAGRDDGDLCLRLARALEVVLGDGRTLHAGTLASLYRRAGDAGRAGSYLAMAAGELTRRGDYPGALASWEDLLARARRGEGGAPELEAQQQVARLHLQQGDAHAARDLYEGLLGRATAQRRLPEQVDALNGLAEVAWRMADYGGALAFANRALALARTARHEPGEARALEQLGVVARRRHDRSANTHLRDALRLYQRRRDELGVARTEVNLGLLARDQEQLAKAERHFDEARARFARLGFAPGLSLHASLIASLRLRQSRYPDALELLSRAQGEEEARGNRRGAALCDQGIGYVYLSEGSYTDAGHHFRQAARVLEALDDRQHLCFAHINLAHTRFRAGDSAQAAAGYREALALAARFGNPASESEARSGLALALHALGDAAAAAREAASAVAGARGTGSRDKEAWARYTKARVTGSVEEAQRALALAEGLERPSLMFMIHHELANLFLARGDRERARHHFQSAFTLIDTLAERMGSARDVFLRKPSVESVFRDATRL